MTELTDFYRQKVTEFLKTVVCFDDHAYDDASGNAGAVKAAAKATDGFPAEDGEGVTAAVSGIVENVSDENPTGFDAKDITDAFADMEILCSVIKPHTDGELAQSQIEKLARTADVAIVDWALENGQGQKDTSIAREAIVKIVKKDEERGGCLRLIVIYSDENGPQVIKELAGLLEGLGFNYSPETLELHNAHTLIVFFQKAGASAAVGVNYKDLPGRVVESFTKLTSGLLPAAALSAISVIRQQSHHLLATFPATLDGAFLTHRCLIPDPNDAEQFFLDLFEGEIGTLLAHSRRTNEAVDGKRCKEWIEEKKFSPGQENSLVTLLTKYNENMAEHSKPLFDKKLKGREFADKIFDLLYDGVPLLTMEKAKEAFSVLSALDAHRRQTTALERKPPRLRLGSIVREKTWRRRYLLCIQPLCDSTRIEHEKETIFPFLILDTLSDNEKNLGLCIPDGANGVVWLGISPKPQRLVSYEFRGKSTTETYVEAVEMEFQRIYTFRTTDGTCPLEWMADLKTGKAQRIVSQLAARIHTLGMHEFEWLRLHGPRTS